MVMRLDSVVIGAKFGSAEAEAAARKAAARFIERGCRVCVVSPVLVDGAEQVDAIEDIGDRRLDLAVTLGGDGTTLRTLRHLADETPVLTINVGGNRGILSEITLDRLDRAMAQMESGDIILEKRIRVAASYAGEEFPPALNEIYITRSNLTRTANMTIKFQNDTVTQKMDGVMVSTPSGSTGHSFSLGGPILHESLDVLIITPVAPMYRLASMVVPDDKIDIIPSHDCNIVMDAQVVKSAGYDETITIKKYRHRAVFVRLKRRGLRQMSKMGF
jgi:NAD+ kinase